LTVSSTAGESMVSRFMVLGCGAMVMLSDID
jgi:hypothetical protein